MALVGESGSGKTTLARAIIGLVEPAAGSIRFSGCEIGALSRGEMKRVRHDMAMMFQDPRGSLSPRLAVRQLITEPYRIHDLKRRDLDAECRRLLGLVGLRSEEHTTELQSLMRTSYAVFCVNKKTATMHAHAAEYLVRSATGMEGF